MRNASFLTMGYLLHHFMVITASSISSSKTMLFPRAHLQSFCLYLNFLSKILFGKVRLNGISVYFGPPLILSQESLVSITDCRIREDTLGRTWKMFSDKFAIATNFYLSNVLETFGFAIWKRKL